MKPLLEQARDKLRRKRVIAVMSGKGGVGKSVIASLLALSMEGATLIDLDLGSMSIPKLFGLSGKFHKVEKRGIEPLVVNKLKIFSLGGIVGDRYVVLPGYGQAGVVEALLALADIDDVNIVVIDMPPGMGEELLSLGRIASYLPVVVSTPSKVSNKVVKHLVDYLIETGHRPKAFALNMAYLECNGQRVYPFGRGEDAKRLGESVGARVYEIPIDPSLEEYIGRLHEYQGSVLKAVGNMARDLIWNF